MKIKYISATPGIAQINQHLKEKHLMRNYWSFLERLEIRELSKIINEFVTAGEQNTSSNNANLFTLGNCNSKDFSADGPWDPGSKFTYQKSLLIAQKARGKFNGFISNTLSIFGLRYLFDF